MAVIEISSRRIADEIEQMQKPLMIDGKFWLQAVVCDPFQVDKAVRLCCTQPQDRPPRRGSVVGFVGGGNLASS